MMEVPSERLLAASASAVELLHAPDDEVVGRSFEDFASDPPSGAIPLLLAGRIRGYETVRLVGRRDAPRPVRFSLRCADTERPPRYVVGILTLERPTEDAGIHCPPPGRQPVLGSANADLLIDWISVEVQQILGVPPDSLLGRSLFGLVAPVSVTSLLWGLAQSHTESQMVPVTVTLRPHRGRERLGQLLLAPRQPAPSCAFSVLTAGAGDSAEPSAGQVDQLLREFVRGLHGASLSRQISDASGNRSGSLARLSAREVEIVSRLLAGDRVPAIAGSLFLAPSTIRNHLTSVYTKLGVHNQQQLIDLLRPAGTDSPRT